MASGPLLFTLTKKKMSFLKKIFKPKAGGTFVGNLLRGAASQATGGVLGQGAMLKASEIKKGWVNPQTGNYTASGLASMKSTGNVSPQMEKLGNSALSGAMDTKEGDSIAMAGMTAKLKSLWANYSMLIITLLGLGLTFAFIWDPKGGKSKYRRR